MQRIIFAILCCVIILTMARTCFSSPRPVISISIGRAQTWEGIDLRKRDKEVLAFTDTLVKEILEHQNFRMALLPYPSESIFDALNLGTVDSIITSSLPKGLKKEDYNFSDAFFKTGLVLVVPIESDAKSLEDMSGQRVGVLVTSSYQPPQKEAVEILVGTFTNTLEGFENMKSGFFDGIIIPIYEARVLTSGIESTNYKVLGAPLTEGGIYFITRKNGSSGLLEEFNEGMEEFHNNGRYDALLKLWRVYQ